jgi:hypothetical protein
LAVGMIVWSAFSYWTEYSENSARRARELLAPPLGVDCMITLDDSEAKRYGGKIVRQSDRWIVLKPAPSRILPDFPTFNVWIPRERILSIEESTLPGVE